MIFSACYILFMWMEDYNVLNTLIVSINNHDESEKNMTNLTNKVNN